eukprot:4875413-Prymnesium_polylepis.1
MGWFLATHTGHCITKHYFISIGAAEVYHYVDQALVVMRRWRCDSRCPSIPCHFCLNAEEKRRSCSSCSALTLHPALSPHAVSSHLLASRRERSAPPRKQPPRQGCWAPSCPPGGRAAH